MSLTRVLRPSLVLTLLLGSLAGTARAQRYWHDEQGRDAFRLDLLMPFLKGNGDKFPTGAIIPSMSVRAADGIRVEADFPLMRGGFDFGGTVGSQTAFRIGNPYVGLRIGEDDKHFSGYLGGRPPLGSKPENAIGAYVVNAATIAYPENSEAFASDLLSLTGGLEWRNRTSGNFLMGGKLGSSLLVTTDGSPLSRTDAYLDYGFRAGYEGTALMTVALTGRFNMTAKDAGTTGRSTHTAAGVFEYRAWAFRPRVAIRIPFDKDIRDQSGMSLAFGVSFAK